MDREDTDPHIRYARDSFNRFYAPNPQDHILDEPETTRARLWRIVVWVAIGAAIAARLAETGF